MPCYHPIEGYRSGDKTVNGKYPFTTNPKNARGRLNIPCGQCIGCRLERSRQWAARIKAEASLYEKNCFITLTYDELHIPENGSLVLEHFQLFMKRLRKKYGSNIRFFHCGEYGERLGRPHYHACLLNFDFHDKSYHRRTDRGDVTYTSSTLSDLWPYGLHEIGDLSFESAAYVARYVTKKVTGNAAEIHYNHVNEYGEIVSRCPEYATMSRRPGIGQPWLEKFRADVYNSDGFVIRGGIKTKTPRAFDRFLEKIDPDELKRVENTRFEQNYGADKLWSYENRRRLLDSTPERLRVREVVQEATLKSTLKRKYEE